MSPMTVIVVEDLCCPRCDWSEELSAEDPDATLSILLSHIRREHADESAMAVLAEAYTTRRTVR